MEDVMAKEALKNLYVEELRDLYDAENRLVKALPKLAKAAESEDLRAGFEEHLEQTKEHVDRLRQIFESLDERPTGKKCAAMIGLIQEGQDILDEDFEDSVKDAALISAAQRVEHYEIAAYGCVKTWAGLLGETEAQSLLEKTLNEEKETDEKLTELSADINLVAIGAEQDEDGSLEEFEEEKEEDEEETNRPLKSKSRGAGAN
jgi:ferritin-like metal-binding protein YciE